MMAEAGVRMGRRGYLIRIGLSVGLFVAAGLLFPVVAIPFLAVEGCWPDGARSNCTGLLSMILAAIYFPLVGIVFVISLVRPLMARLRDIGINPLYAFAVLALMLPDYQFLMVGVGLLTSVFLLGGQRPDFVLEALALMVAIGCVPAREGRLILRNIGWPLWLAAALAALMGLRLMLELLQSVDGFLRGQWSL